MTSIHMAKMKCRSYFTCYRNKLFNIIYSKELETELVERIKWEDEFKTQLESLPREIASLQQLIETKDAQLSATEALLAASGIQEASLKAVSCLSILSFKY